MILETIERIKSETPKYWRKIRNFAVIVVTIATITLTFIDDKEIINLCNYIIAIGLTLGISAQTTKV